MSENYPILGPIIIGTNNIEKAKAFYIPVFGLEVKEESLHYLSGHLSDGTHIEIEEDSENRFPNWKEHNVGTYKNSEFQVKDIFEFHKVVIEHGGTIVSNPIERPWGGYGSEISDPEGNIFLISSK